MTMLLGAILLSAHILTVSTAPVVPDQIGCAEGEPLVDDPAPIVNLTILPSLTIVELEKVTVICGANSPAGPSDGGNPLPPTKILIYFGKFQVMECGDGSTPIYQCVYSLNSFFPVLDRVVSCTAVNADLQCRFKVATVTLVKERKTTTIALPSSTVLPSTTQGGNMTTLPPSTKTERNMTTSPPNITDTTKSSGGRIFLTPFALITMMFWTVLGTFK